MLGKDSQVPAQDAQRGRSGLTPPLLSLGPDSSWRLPAAGLLGFRDSPPGLALGEIMQVAGTLSSVPPHMCT